MNNRDTNLIRGGLQRSEFKETSEALFLNSGFVYDSAEQAEAIFKGEQSGYQYSRYANPTVDMFEKKLALLDKSESCFATASGMSAVFGAMMCQLKSGDHVVSASALFGSCRYIVKDILQNATKESKCEISYLAAGKYRISLTGTNFKEIKTKLSRSTLSTSGNGQTCSSIFLQFTHAYPVKSRRIGLPCFFAYSIPVFKSLKQSRSFGQSFGEK